MSTLAILPVSSVVSTINYTSTGNASAPQTAFDSLLSQLQTAISAGDLTSSQSLLHALDAISPTSPAQNSALGALLSGVGSALENGSFTDAQAALATYLNATSSSANLRAASSPAQSATTNPTFESSQVQSQLQLNLVQALLLPPGSNAPSGAAANDSVSSLVAFLNTAYGNGESSAGATSAQSPYETLVSALKANLAAGIRTAGPALAYLQSKGSLVSVEA